MFSYIENGMGRTNRSEYKGKMITGSGELEARGFGEYDNFSARKILNMEVSQ